MTAKEWLEIIKQAKDFNPDMEKIIIQYGAMRESESRKFIPCEHCNTYKICKSEHKCYVNFKDEKANEPSGILVLKTNGGVDISSVHNDTGSCAIGFVANENIHSLINLLQDYVRTTNT